MDNNKYAPPAGAPPNYPMSPPPAQHYDAGPYQQQGQWGPPQGPGYDQYGNQYGPPQQGYYGPQGQMQYYQQGPPPQGYYVEQSRGPGAAEGCCAALLASLACCCCLDILF